ncbi:bacteriophage abortive infection AbiH family protein [Exiguobacterium sp. N5]|uniref:bacteriophage abortive infection AbiH family protein n=1 Tax=Exiguobacterium sp. N5 TaxID=2990450 RepID=UPI0021F45B71|nr:bacteriophage abortive infection AbiH family protein [Exiguobacterium sp. N5]MCV9901350.1 bacteriophage abortive infection AbiH family protein [Exiguobacterium sp. N5]
MNLFIVGNGFDLAHGRHTEYSDFHEYLKITYPEALHIEPSFNFSSTTLPDGSELYEQSEVVAFIMDVISRAEADGENWCDIENSLGMLDYANYYDDMSNLFDEDDKKYNPFHMAYNYEDVSNDFYKVTSKIKDLFSEWINTIQISDVIAKKSFEEIIDISNDYCISFNYTRILEKIYRMKNVFHLHGLQNSEIIIGHGILRTEFENIYTGTEDILWEIHHSLKKDTDKIIENWGSLFNSLNSVDKIYSHGFSFSDVDLPYIEKICEVIDTENITWFLNDYEDDTVRDKYMSRIRRCGYEGAFSVFSI